MMIEPVDYDITVRANTRSVSIEAGDQGVQMALDAMLHENQDFILSRMQEIQAHGRGVEIRNITNHQSLCFAVDRIIVTLVTTAVSAMAR